MLKKLIATLLIASVFAVPVYAQSRFASQPISRREGQTNLSNLGLLGGPGDAPAYLMFQGLSSGQAGVGIKTGQAATGEDAGNYSTELYYLWIDSGGNLRIASQSAIGGSEGTSASPPITYWDDSSGAIVGNQSN